MGKSSNKPGKFLRPHLTLCTSTTARDAAGLGLLPSLPTAVHTVWHRCLSARTACETNVKTLPNLFLDATSASHRGYFCHSMPTHPLYFSVSRSYRYCTYHSSQRWPEGLQSTITETASQFSSLSKAIRKPRKEDINTAKFSFQLQKTV